MSIPDKEIVGADNKQGVIYFPNQYIQMSDPTLPITDYQLSDSHS